MGIETLVGPTAEPDGHHERESQAGDDRQEAQSRAGRSEAGAQEPDRQADRRIADDPDHQKGFSFVGPHIRDEGSDEYLAPGSREQQSGWEGGEYPIGERPALAAANE